MEAQNFSPRALAGIGSGWSERPDWAKGYGVGKRGRGLPDLHFIFASPGSGRIGTCQPVAPGSIRAPAVGTLHPDCGRRFRLRRVSPSAGSGSLLPTSPAHPWAEAALEASRPCATKQGHQCRSPRSQATGAAHPSPARRSGTRAPNAEGRARPGRQSRLPPPPRSLSPRPSRQGGGGLGFKDTLTHAASKQASRTATPRLGGHRWPHLPPPRFLLPPAHPTPGGKLWGGG